MFSSCRDSHMYRSEVPKRITPSCSPSSWPLASPLRPEEKITSNTKKLKGERSSLKAMVKGVREERGRGGWGGEGKERGREREREI